MTILQTAGRPRHAGETRCSSQRLRCQGRALTFPGNPTPCPLSAGGQRKQKGAGQGELCHRDEGWDEGQREGGWFQGGIMGKRRSCIGDGEETATTTKKESDLKKLTNDQWRTGKRETGGHETEGGQR